MPNYLSLPDYTQLRYDIRGSGPVLVIQAPGWGCGADVYEQTLGTLAEDFTVVTHDPRGSGDTLVLDPNSINIGQHVEDLARLIEYLGVEKCSLLGHSHGGWISLLYAANYPDMLDKLILVCAEMESIDGFDVAQNAFLEKRKSTCEYAVLQMFEAASCQFSNLQSDFEFMDWFHTVMPLYAHNPADLQYKFSTVSLTDFSVQALHASHRSNALFPVGDLLSEIQVPTLVLNGSSDFLGLRLMAERFAQTLPKVQQEVISNAGHFPWMERASAFFPMVKKFLLEEFVLPETPKPTPIGDARTGGELDTYI